MRTGVIVYPGSNCDRDVINAILYCTSKKPIKIWHKEINIPNLDLIILPGGFSYGDYLRCGAIASKSPIIQSLKDHISRGGAVLGICNGFQILIETKLLPGSLIRNAKLKFICKDVLVEVQDTKSTPFFQGLNKGEILNFPIAHNEGNFYADNELLKKLENNGQIAFKYFDKNSINGSKKNIAGILSSNGRVLGMMPHPERSIYDFHSSQDGKYFFKMLFENLLG